MNNDTAPPKPPGAKPLKRFAIVLGFGSIICIFLAEVLPFYGRIFVIPSIALVFLAILLGSLQHRRELLNNNATKRNANLRSIPYIVGGFVLCVIVGWEYGREIPPKPHLKLCLQTGKSLLDCLELTNEFLFFPDDKPIIRNMLGVLLVPVLSPNSNAALKFFALNDSRTVDELGRLTVIFPTNLVCSPGKPEPGASPWQTLESIIPKFQAVGIRSSGPLFRDERGVCPELNFRKIGGWTRESMPMIILISGKDMDNVSMGFWLSCPTVSNPKPPQLVLGERDVSRHQVVVKASVLDELLK